MLNLFIGEFLGTFIFLSAIIFSVGFNPNDMLILFKVGLGLIVACAIFGKVTGAHFNPAVSIMFYLNNQLSIDKLFLYILAQIAGGVTALLLFKYMAKSIQKN
jgi:glycerol uptake facilitator-like aquaporin